ncbi:MAG: hypothetical protein COB78_09850 [Hyphomicrobiales bacterium]|nr:MAG: hypothetical protein COB78_09850 [Hyphomicrobiales bacterium]
MKTEQLKPCPFCGGSKIHVLPPTCRPETPYDPSDRLFPIAKCFGCYVEVSGENEDYTSKSAIKAWNRRSTPTPLSEEDIKRKYLKLAIDAVNAAHKEQEIDRINNGEKAWVDLSPEEIEWHIFDHLESAFFPEDPKLLSTIRRIEDAGKGE